MELKEKEERLRGLLCEAGSLMVAYSGGTDSAYLAYAAHRELGDRMVAVLADSPSLARSQYEDAAAFAREQGIPLRIVKTGELEDEEYAANSPERCFHCKDELFNVLDAECARGGYGAVAYGLNRDDRSDFRPGQRAARRHGVIAPLAEAELTKDEVRALARAAGLRLWDKPASACLASRIEYGRRVTAGALRMVEEAEDALRELGLRRFRVRHHGSVARVEVAEEEMASVLSTERMKLVAAAVKRAGFTFVALDCEGYRTGAMNEILPADVLRGEAGQPVAHPAGK